MADARLRAMERAAAMGDQRAAEEARWSILRYGVGDCEVHGVPYRECRACVVLATDPRYPVPGTIRGDLAVLDVEPRPAGPPRVVVVSREGHVYDMALSTWTRAYDWQRYRSSAGPWGEWSWAGVGVHRHDTGTVHATLIDPYYRRWRAACGSIHGIVSPSEGVVAPWDVAGITCSRCRVARDLTRPMRRAPESAVRMLRRWTYSTDHDGVRVYRLDLAALGRAVGDLTAEALVTSARATRPTTEKEDQ